MDQVALIPHLIEKNTEDWGYEVVFMWLQSKMAPGPGHQSCRLQNTLIK